MKSYRNINMENKNTECECPLAGFCNRHGIKKNNHYHKLCQNHPGYFQMWEECRGPGQQQIDCHNKEQKTEEEVTKSQKEVNAIIENFHEGVRDTRQQVIEAQGRCALCNNRGCSGECRNNQQLPSKIKMAKNLISATKEHAKTGFAKAGNELQAERLEICKGCEFYIPDQDRCGKCGCPLKSKSAWKSSKCPIGKW